MQTGRTAELSKERVEQEATRLGLDLFGVASIERFAGAPESMHPRHIFPRARSVIVVGKRVLRGGWRGIEEGTYWPNYTYFNYHGLLNSFFIHEPMYRLACFVEDHGWEAVPYYPGVPEAQPPVPPLREGAPPPDVHLSIRIAALAAGLGEIGWSKVFLTRRFGPRVRLAAILTDLPLEPDPLVEPNSICRMDMACVQGCPGAIPHVREGRSVSIRIEDRTYRWADVDMGKCTLIYHGGDPRVSPFLHRDFPGLCFDVTSQQMSEEAAYKFCWTLSTAPWRRTREFPSGSVVEGHSCLMKWGEAGSYGIEGSRGCMRSCYDYLENAGAVEQTFLGGPFIRRKRWMLPSRVAGSKSDPPPRAR